MSGQALQGFPLPNLGGLPTPFQLLIRSIKMNKRLSLSEAFWPKVEKTETCWIWQGAKDPRGYGRVYCTFKPKEKVSTLRAHKVALILSGIDVPNGMCVLHKCDNPSCVNPSHLFIGTQVDNMKDMASKGRGRNQWSDVTHCKRGHELTEDNIYRSAATKQCRKCNLMRSKQRYQRLHPHKSNKD